MFENDYTNVNWNEVFEERNNIPSLVFENGYECPCYGVIKWRGREYPLYTDDYGCQDFIIYHYTYKEQEYDYHITVQNMGGMLDWYWELDRMISVYEKESKDL